MILGASGFIGSAVLKAALGVPDLEQIYVPEHNSPVQENDHPGLVKWNSSLQDLRFPSPLPEYVIHAARQASSRGRMGRLFRSLLGQHANSRIAQTYNNPGILSKLWYISGSLMYGNGGTAPVTEEWPVQPMSFAREYIHAERPFNRQASPGGPIGLFRVPWVYGPGSWFERFYLKPMTTHNFIPLYGPGLNVMTFIEREDLGNVILKAAALPHPVMNLFLPDPVTQETFAALLQQYSGLPIHRIPIDTVREQYGAAVSEAFSSSIRLDTVYDQEAIRAHMRFSSTEQMIAVTLPGMLG
jgi:nucleoside-diphosphate-sugar epimerase